jgi:MYXO-CTERM domain-containing protein
MLHDRDQEGRLRMGIHAAITALACATAATADFSGQPIVDVLSNGSVVSGTTLGKADDNDGFESGIHIFDIWDGGDDVYQLIWGGGDLTVSLLSSGVFTDNDLFLYSPGSLDSTGDYSIRGATDSVTLLGAAAGTYYINIDSTASSEGEYQLSVVPAPGAVALLGVAIAGLRRRSRR